MSDLSPSYQELIDTVFAIWDNEIEKKNAFQSCYGVRLVNHLDDDEDDSDNSANSLPIEQPLSVVPNGFFKFSGVHGGLPIYLRVHTQREKSKFAPGQRIVSILIGENHNSISDYERFAFLDDSGIYLWKRFKERDDLQRLTQFLWACYAGEHSSAWANKLEVDKRCLICNHKLRNEVSWQRGMGDNCYKKVYRKGK